MNSARISLLLAACAAAAAAATSGWAAAASAPSADPAPYRSAFEGYRPFREEPLADWRAVNDEVARVGGHIGILRAPDAPAAESAARGETGQPPVRSAPQAPGDRRHH